MDAAGKTNSMCLAPGSMFPGEGLYVYLAPLGVQMGWIDSRLDFKVYRALGLDLVTGARDAPGFSA